jgi:hypothetical protein
MAAMLALSAAGAGEQKPAAQDKGGDRAGAPARPDSYWYYGPNDLWKKWTPAQKRGRDTWILWTGGNQKFLRWATEYAGSLKVPVSIEMYRALDSRNRAKRFQQLGLINEPNCVAATKPDQYGLWFDEWLGDPIVRKAGGNAFKNADYSEGRYPYYPDPEVKEYADEYGAPTGVVGLRKFKNPLFDPNKWDVRRYFEAPGAVQPPYLLGFSCAICHIAFDPTNPPRDPAKPRWDNLAANIGNQYFREGDLFFARGRIVFGDRHPGPNYAKDPYDTGGIGPQSLLFWYAVTQPLGTSETSRISYDFINNPTIINTIVNLPARPTFVEKAPDGKLRAVKHVLADGADSVGLPLALLRVWINIGCEGYYWKDTLFNPVTGERQRPLNIDELLLTDRVTKERKQELEATYGTYLRKRYGHGLGADWKKAWARNPDLASYLSSYTGYKLDKALDGLAAQAAHLQDAERAQQLGELVKKWRPDQGAVKRGKLVFAGHCVQCHSSKQPDYPLDWSAKQRAKYLHDSVQAADFLDNNTLSNDQRYSVEVLGTNMGRALATNAVDGDVWARFSSETYKALPPVGPFVFDFTVDKNGQLMARGKNAAANPKTDIHIRFTPPGGGRGYYRSPTLVGMWATAPYLHNNSVGDYCVIKRNPQTGAIVERKLVPPDSKDLLDHEIDCSVEGRLLMFQDGVERLLGLKERHGYMLRTQTDCDLFELQPVLKQLLPGVLHDWLFAFVRHRLQDAAEALIAEHKLPPEKAQALLQQLQGFAKELDDLNAQLTPEDLAKLRERIGLLVKTRLIERAKEVLPEPVVAAAAARFEAVRKQLATEAEALIARDFLRVPRGTPVNLYFNLPASAFPYALKAHIVYRDDPRSRYDTLLRLSDCPDLVEDRGHDFGANLTAQEKRDLIEFLKTF